jgi:hypothetical protein
MTTYTFNILKDIMKTDYDMLKYRDEDNVSVLTGREGKGKSRLSLHQIEIWFDIAGIEKTPTNFKKAMGVRFIQWAKIMSYNAQIQNKCFINVFDEAGDVLSGKHANNRAVRCVEDSYKVIRGLNALSIITTPSLFILSPYFRYHRVRVLYYVEKRGLCHVYFDENLFKLQAMNENRDFKDMSLIEPNFSFVYPDYKGVFLETYLKMKESKMFEVLKNMRSEAERFDYTTKKDLAKFENETD